MVVVNTVLPIKPTTLKYSTMGSHITTGCVPHHCRELETRSTRECCCVVYTLTSARNKNIAPPYVVNGCIINRRHRIQLYRNHTERHMGCLVYTPYYCLVLHFMIECCNKSAPACPVYVPTGFCLTYFSKSSVVE